MTMCIQDRKGMDTHDFVKKALRAAKREVHLKIMGMVSPNILFYVISHERSGTHFTINNILRSTFIRQDYHSIREWFGPYDNFSHKYTHIDKFNSTWEKAHKKAAIMKSHCGKELFEAAYKKAKVIYVLRDPRDTLTSWFHYLNRDEYYWHNPMVSDHRCRSFSEFLRRPASPFLRWSYSLHGNFSNVAERWASHVSGWLNMPDALVIRYEDLHRNNKPVLEDICEFMGLRPRWRLRSIGLNEGRSILPRRGVIGDWKNMFSDADEAFVREAVEQAGIDWDLVAKH